MDDEDSLLSDSIAVAVEEGVLNIFDNYGEDNGRLSVLLSDF
jgi:hypothetical protein